MQYDDFHYKDTFITQLSFTEEDKPTGVIQSTSEQISFTKALIIVPKGQDNAGVYLLNLNNKEHHACAEIAYKSAFEETFEDMEKKWLDAEFRADILQTELYQYTGYGL